MNTQSIQGTTSWVQFMQLTQAARNRNNGFAAAQVNAAQQAGKVQSERRVGDVYSRALNTVSQGQSGAKASEAVKKTVGCHFDAYA